jgi:hypothetical protein
LVFKPLLPFLKGIKKISYSPAGLLYRIAFQALPAGDSQLLIDKYELNQYISTRQLAVEKEVPVVKDKSIILFGDVTFSMDSISIVKQKRNNEMVSGFYTSLASRGETRDAWISLPGTATEIKDIQSLFELIMSVPPL